MVVYKTMYRPAKIYAIFLATALMVLAIPDRIEAFAGALYKARLQQGRRRALSEVGFVDKDSHNVEKSTRFRLKKEKKSIKTWHTVDPSPQK